MLCSVIFFFFTDTATTEIYTLSLHDALPISAADDDRAGTDRRASRDDSQAGDHGVSEARVDRKSTRLNSSHVAISYAVFCLKKKKKSKKNYSLRYVTALSYNAWT